MKKLLLEAFKIGATIATTLTAKAIGADKEMSIAIGTMVGTTVSGIIDMTTEKNHF